LLNHERDDLMVGPNDGMRATTTTSWDRDPKARTSIKPVPGVVLIFADRRPCQHIFRADSGSIELGRLELAIGETLDSMVSRQHVRLAFDGSDWSVADLGSRNGTFVGGDRITGVTPMRSGGTVRVGGAVLLLVADVLPFEHYGVGIRDGVVGGPSLWRALEAVTLTQRVGMVASLLITGETGSGKEIAAKAFHRSGPKPNAPFSAVNCATIPKDLAERLLFGSRRGAFSGATDATGYVQAAHGGTLFLDEVAELPLDVQSKLLRMLEMREVLRLGATSPEPVDVRVCAATWRDLREQVSAGRFREDLYFRIGQPEVQLPPLRERVEEIGWHVQHVLDDCAGGRPLNAASDLIEAYALRAWPGNVRELRAEVRRAAAAAVAQGSNLLTAEDLSPIAGTPLSRSSNSSGPTTFPDDEIAAALAVEKGNVASAARLLGIHRNKVRRWLERHQIDAAAFKTPGKSRPT
jgi:Sigma-54 interaction domain/FHA domain/Bacterial regulatory protein, Fis family